MSMMLTSALTVCCVVSLMVWATGTINTAASSAWKASDNPCARLNCSLRLQMLRTLTGLLVTFSGGSLGGAIASRRFSQNTRYQGFHSTSMRERAAHCAAGGSGRNHSFRFSKNPPPKPPSEKGTWPLWFRGSFTGRSVRNSFTLEKKLWAQDLSSRAKRGRRAAEAFPCAAEVPFGLLTISATGFTLADSVAPFTTY